MKTSNSILLILLSAPSLVQGQSEEGAFGRKVSSTLKFVSPLQSLTIFPKDVPSTTPREEFLPKFKAGLAAEKDVRERIVTQRDAVDSDDYVGKDFGAKNAQFEKMRSEKEEELVEKAYDAAVAGFDQVCPSKISKKNASKYQFVGVVQPPDAEKKVKWFARKRPADSKWNVRLLHANRDAIVRDMFVNGKVDVFAKYVNSGNRRDALQEGEDASAPSRPLIQAEYNIKKRTPFNLWNFNAKHFFTDSSGAFWRERRLTPGLYTDGKIVYEQKYRYSDGKNGMKPISRLDTLLRSSVIKEDVKTNLLKRLENDAPDIVIEK